MDYDFHVDIRDDIKVAHEFLGLTREPDVYTMALGGIAVTPDMPGKLRSSLGGPYRRLEFETIKELGRSKVATLQLILQSEFVDRHFYLTSTGTEDKGHQQPFSARPLNSQVETTKLTFDTVALMLRHLIPAQPGVAYTAQGTEVPLSVFDALAHPRNNYSFNDIAHNIGSLLTPHARSGEVVRQYLAGQPPTSPPEVPTQTPVYDRSQAALTVIERPNQPLRYNLSLSAPYDIHGRHVNQHVSYSFVDDENLPDAETRVRLVSHDMSRDDLRAFARQTNHLDAAYICHHALSYFRQPLEEPAA
jgi:hypothetical protein